MFKDLIDDQSARSANQSSNKYAVLTMRHRTNRRTGTRSGADGLRCAFQRMVEPAIGTLDVLIRAERFVSGSCSGQVHGRSSPSGASLPAPAASTGHEQGPHGYWVIRVRGRTEVSVPVIEPGQSC